MTVPAHVRTLSSVFASIATGQRYAIEGRRIKYTDGFWHD